AFLGTDPPPPTPNQPHRSPKGGNIMQDPLLAAVPVGDQPAYSASFEVRGGFDGDHQPAMITNAFDGVQPLDSEKFITPPAVRRHRGKQARRIKHCRGPLGISWFCRY